MVECQKASVSRRRLLKAGGSAALLTGVAPAIISSRARAQQKTLKIVMADLWVPGYQQWFEEFIKVWGAQNDTQVVVDYIKDHEQHRTAAAEAAAQQGHDLVALDWSPGLYEDHVIDHREIYDECERRHGKALELAIKSSHNPKTGKFYAFVSRYYPLPINYRKDLWDAVGMMPDTWENVRLGGRRIKLLRDHSVGIGLAPELDSNGAMRTILYSFGGSVQDADNGPALKSKPTLEAIKFVKALFEEAMTEDVLTWDNVSNNQFMLSGQGSLVLNPISITRTGERKDIPVTDDIWLARPPQGPTQRLAPQAAAEFWVIWKFAANIDGAKQFLVDFIAQSRDQVLTNEYFTLPCFPVTVPDMAQLLANDARANPPNKYRVLADAAEWTTNVGYPGYANPAVDEIFEAGLLPTMFAQAATGQLTPEEALDQADQEVRQIFAKWHERGKI